MASPPSSSPQSIVSHLGGIMKVDAAIMDCERARARPRAGSSSSATTAASPSKARTIRSSRSCSRRRPRERIELYTAIAVAFARNPMLLANIGWDLQALSKGRFLLGLGTQIRAHIEKRFRCRGRARRRACARWCSRSARSGAAGAEGGRLDFRGEFYQHTLMIADVQPGREPVRESADLRGRRGPAHDRGGGRGGRRLLRAPVQQREVDRAR